MGLINCKQITNDPTILLHPNIPKPLHGLNPRTILGKGWWDKHRQIAYAAHDYHCHACGIHKSDAKYHQWLEGHEFYSYDWKIGRLELKKIVALCHMCHNFIHDGRMQHLWREGVIDKKFYDRVIEHGVSYTAKLINVIIPDTSHLSWSDWHIRIKGKDYHSKFKNQDEWYDFYNKLEN